MPNLLSVSIGQYSDKGRKPANQDFCGAHVPNEIALLATKGVALAIADGVSSSAVSRVAAEAAVNSFLSDYYCTPESWTVATAARRVIAAANSWLHAQTRGHGYGHDRERGYVTTFSALVLKSRTAHLFHVGDARVWRVSGATLEQLSVDHTIFLSTEESYLGRALGVDEQVEIDHLAVPIEAGDVFVLTTDGVHDHLRGTMIVRLIRDAAGDLDQAAQAIVDQAHGAGSTDNLTAQVARVDSVPDGDPEDLYGGVRDRPAAPVLEPPALFDGYRIERVLHASSRSHVYFAVDEATGAPVALKIPSVDQRDDDAYLRRFMMEDWIARRLDSPHVLKAFPRTRRSHIYLAMEYVEGRSLAQWIRDHRPADLEAVRRIIEQIAVGLRAFHRKEMLHRDLRPQNVLLDDHGTAKIIDFGSVLVAGLAETEDVEEAATIVGSLQYTAPECFLGEVPTRRSDLFALGVMTYEMLTGRLPYDGAVVRADTRARQRRLRYHPARDHRPDLPSWVDDAIEKAVHPDPLKRYDALSAFLHDLRYPNRSLQNGRRLPLMEQDPLLVWKALSLLLALVVIVLLFSIATTRSRSGVDHGWVPLGSPQSARLNSNGFDKEAFGQDGRPPTSALRSRRP